MPGLLLAMLGGLAYYSRSKYFPEPHRKLKGVIPPWLGAVLLFCAADMCIYRYGTGMGVLMATVIIPTAYCLLVFILNLSSRYLIFTLSVLLIFLFIDILS